MTPSESANGRAGEVVIRVRLYVAGSSPNSVSAVQAMNKVLEEFAARRIAMELIDVLEDPLRGAREGILVTPLLVKLEPPPERRVLGNLRDRKVVLEALGLNEPPRV